MTPNDFRKLALSFPETEERAHMNHPDFRVAGKIFATLGYPNTERGMVKVTPIEQEMLVGAEPSVFSPESGAWGRQGCTRVNLKAAKKTTPRGGRQPAHNRRSEFHAAARVLAAIFLEKVIRK